MPNQQNNSNKTILITGCSSGFGLITASYLASRGYKVAATMRNLDKQKDLLDEVKNTGSQIQIYQLDVTHIASIKNAVSETISRFGTIDVLINNAGFGLGGFFEDLSEEEIRAQMETNFFGVQNVSRCVIPYMREQRKGRIINISSVAGLSASPCFGAYNASKWALEGFSESLYFELKPFGIDVILIEPGTYKTKIFYENSKYAKNFDNPKSPYFNLSQNLKRRVMDYVASCKKDPKEIALLIEKLITKKNPPLRNIPDFSNKLFYLSRKFIPFKLYSYILNKVLSNSAK